MKSRELLILVACLQAKLLSTSPHPEISNPSNPLIFASSKSVTVKYTFWNNQMPSFIKFKFITAIPNVRNIAVIQDDHLIMKNSLYILARLLCCFFNYETFHNSRAVSSTSCCATFSTMSSSTVPVLLLRQCGTLQIHNAFKL